MLRKYFESQLIKPRPVMEALDLAMEVLFPYTSFQVVRFFVESCGSPGSISYAALVCCTNPFCNA